jgi:hypothetical protein
LEEKDIKLETEVIKRKIIQVSENLLFIE